MHIRKQTSIFAYHLKRKTKQFKISIMTTYRDHSIETVLSSNHEPRFVAIIDGVFHTNYTNSDTKVECIEKAKKEVDKMIKYDDKRKHN